MTDGVKDKSDDCIDFAPERGIRDESLDEEEHIPPAKQIYNKMMSNSLQ